MRKKQISKMMHLLLSTTAVLGAFALTACSVNVTVNAPDATKDEATGTGTTDTEVTQKEIEENIIGTWIVTDRNGHPALTNEKGVFTFDSPTEAYISASFEARPKLGSHWIELLEADVDITGNKVTVTWPVNDDTVMVDELTISKMTDNEKQGNLMVKSIEAGEETIIREEPVRLIKINADYRDDIIGTWEGRCTSDGSVYDDGQDHRWEYKSDGTYVYYVKDGDDWIPSDNTLNEYFVDGNLLCGRWIENDEEYREWWEVSIDGDTMNWTALREDEDGNTYTAEFEMTKVEENSGKVTQEQIEENIIGAWMLSEQDGQPVLTNEKNAFEVVSTTEAYSGVSRVNDHSSPWHAPSECDIKINKNTVTLTTITNEGSTIEREFTITDIREDEFTANMKFMRTSEGSEPITRENVVTFIKVNDYSKDIIGTWEGRCTSEKSLFDDGQEHRWEYREDGSFVYYKKDGDKWVAPANSTNDEYFVTGNLLCARWFNGEQENREWWEITIDGDTMNWTALREDEDGTTYTATFEMDRIEE